MHDVKNSCKAYFFFGVVLRPIPGEDLDPARVAADPIELERWCVNEGDGLISSLRVTLGLGDIEPGFDPDLSSFRSITKYSN